VIWTRQTFSWYSLFFVRLLAAGLTVFGRFMAPPVEMAGGHRRLHFGVRNAIFSEVAGLLAPACNPSVTFGIKRDSR
jgi:hypothetical protein